jgi:hypothetical protein
MVPELEHPYGDLGCALVFGSEAKIKIEAKISFRFEEKERMFSLVSHRSENKKSDAKKMGNEREKNQGNAEGRFYTCISTD